MSGNVSGTCACHVDVNMCTVWGRGRGALTENRGTPASSGMAIPSDDPEGEVSVPPRARTVNRPEPPAAITRPARGFVCAPLGVPARGKPKRHNVPPPVRYL